MKRPKNNKEETRRVTKNNAKQTNALRKTNLSRDTNLNCKEVGMERFKFEEIKKKKDETKE